MWIPAKARMRRQCLEWRESPLTLSFSPWEKEPSNYPQRALGRPLSQGERDRVRGDSLHSRHHPRLVPPDAFQDNKLGAFQ